MSRAHPDLHVLTHAFPARRASDLRGHHQEPCVQHPVQARRARPDEGGAEGFRAPVGVTPDAIRHAVVGSSTDGTIRLGAAPPVPAAGYPLENPERSEEHTSELQSLMRNSYAVFRWKKKRNQ